MIRKYLAVMLFAALFPEPVSASTFALHRNVDEAFRLDPVSYTLETRRALAVAQDRYWSDFLERLPDLSESERSKIVDGINSTDNFRHAEALTSKNGLLYLARDSVSNCKAAAAELVINVGGQIKSETVAWLKLIRCFDNVRSLPAILKEAGFVEKENYLKPYYMQSVGTWSSQTVGVVERLLMDLP